MNKKRAGSVFVVIGAVLMFSALLLFVYNSIEAKIAANASNEAMSALLDAIENPSADTGIMSADSSAESATESISPTEEAVISEPDTLETVEIGGYDYIGYLSIPAYELELPIMAQISEDRLYKSPCLHFGSPITDDAVIAGHNYKYHFLPLHDIEVGENVFFTYMNQYVVPYTVVKTVIIHPTDIAAVQDSEHDLVLYTCTSNGASRVAVYCDRVEMN